MAKTSAPAAPNPVTTAQAQTQSNEQTAVANAGLGNINQVTPTSSTNFAQTGGYTDPTTGQFIPSYTETQTLDPALNSVLTGTENIASNLTNGAANNLAGQIQTASTTPLNFNTGANSQTINAGPQVLDQNTANAVYNTQASFLNPQWQQNQQNLTDQLSQEGIPVGSSAWNDAQTQFNNARTQAYNTAASQATYQAVPAAASMYNMALLGQQQQVGQQQLAQQTPINLLGSLYGAGVA